MRRISLSLLGLAAAVACTDATRPRTELDLQDLPATVLLRVGQELTIDGVGVTVQSVTGDSRCPIDAECVWQGDATVMLAVGPLVGQGPAYQLSLRAGGTPHMGDALGLRFTLLSLAPQPRGGHPIQQDQYRIELDIRSTPVSAP